MQALIVQSWHGWQKRAKWRVTLIAANCRKKVFTSMWSTPTWRSTRKSPRTSTHVVLSPYDWHVFMRVCRANLPKELVAQCPSGVAVRNGFHLSQYAQAVLFVVRTSIYTCSVLILLIVDGILMCVCLVCSRAVVVRVLLIWATLENWYCLLIRCA